MQINKIGWQNQYSNTAMDLTSAAGLKELESFYWTSVAKGSALQEQPDFGLCNPSEFASLSAAHDMLRRHVNEDMLKLGFTNIKVLNMTMIPDPAISDGDIYMINTNYCRLQVLRSPQLKTVGDTPQTLPITIGPMQNDIDTFNKVQLWRITFNLTTCSLQRQGLVDNAS